MSSKTMSRSFSARALLAVLFGLAAVLGLTAGPAQAAPATSTVHIWADQVRVRECADAASCGLATSERLTDVNVTAFCQRWGGYVSDGPYYNHYWLEIVTPGHRLGWVSAVYVSGGSNDGPVPGVPVETDSSPVYCEYV